MTQKILMIPWEDQSFDLTKALLLHWKYNVTLYSTPAKQIQFGNFEKICAEFCPKILIANRDDFNGKDHEFCKLMKESLNTKSIGLFFVYKIIRDYDKNTSRSLCWADEYLQLPIFPEELETRLRRMFS